MEIIGTDTIVTHRPGQPGFRHLSSIANVRPSDVCEMGDEEDCTEVPAFWLTAPASYVMPMLLCASHAEAESVYFGTPMPEAK